MDELRRIFTVIRDAFWQSDLIGRWIVIILGVLSAVSWSIMLYRGGFVNSWKNKCRAFRQLFETKGSALDLGYGLDENEGPLQAICDAGFKALREVLEISEDEYRRMLRHGVLPRTLSSAELEKIRLSMIRCSNRLRVILTEHMVWLATIVSMAPFMGLFGTVWGVMMTFVELAAAGGQKADLSQLAPGVSGALLTTVAGLLVAMPAVCGNNYIVNSMELVLSDMDAFVDDFIAQLRLEDGSILDGGTRSNDDQA